MCLYLGSIFEFADPKYKCLPSPPHPHFLWKHTRAQHEGWSLIVIKHRINRGEEIACNCLLVPFRRTLMVDIGMVKHYLQCNMKANSASHLALQNKVIHWTFNREDGEVPSSNIPRWQVTKQHGFYVRLWETTRAPTCGCVSQQRWWLCSGVEGWGARQRVKLSSLFSPE